MKEEEYPVMKFKWRPHIGSLRVTVVVRFKDYGDRIALVSCHQADYFWKPRSSAALQNWARHWLLEPDNLATARSIAEPV